jgi:D-lyxose ketol-isomerase
MKRSELNKIMKEAIAFIGKHGYVLPPFVLWSPKEWNEKGHQYDEIRDNMLGWDITDFGSGDYKRIGLLLITVRNGNVENSKYSKPYAEKIMIVQENQVTPMHFHWAKMEDIINRGGGNLMIQVYNSTADDKLADTPVTVTVDGCKSQVAAGTILKLTPGQSISVQQRMYHAFWGEESRGTVLVGEVSKVNDDKADNRFLEPAGRFPNIEENEAPLHLLCNEYPPAP